MTSLAHDTLKLRRKPRHFSPWADRVVLAVLVASIAAALALAAATILADLPLDAPSLIPFDQPAALSNFTA